MNSILFYFIFILLSFLILGVSIKIIPKEAMFTIAIGAVIGSNIYNSINYPIDILGLNFGIDSIVYTIFMFCLLLMYIDYGKKDFKALLYTSLFSILFTAFLYFMGTFSQQGYSLSLLLSTLSYINSIIGTFLGAFAMIKVYDFLKKKNCNIYINIFLCMIVASLINSLIYFVLTFIINHSIIDSMLISLAGSYIGKLISSLLCLLIFFLHTFKSKKTKEKIKQTNEENIENSIDNNTDNNTDNKK